MFQRKRIQSSVSREMNSSNNIRSFALIVIRCIVDHTSVCVCVLVGERYHWLSKEGKREKRT